MDPNRRRELTRFGAPAAFLAAATIAVLLIKAGLSGGSEAPPTVGALPTARSTATQPGTTTKLVLTGTTAATNPSGAQYYVIQSGDTLGSIALKYDTTVEQLLGLNPGVDPNALHPGDRIRVS
jgi:LysM repeat protein